MLLRAPAPGIYTTCFKNNKGVSPGMKTISFLSQVGGEGDVEAEGGLTQGRHRVTGSQVMEAGLIRITNGLQEMRGEQAYVATRERHHRDTVESTNTRVLVWGVAEVVGLGVMTVVQLGVLKRSFGTQRGV